MRRLVLVALAAVLGWAPAAVAQDACPEGRPLTGDPGIDRYRCVGGACEIWARTGRGFAHVFTTEPRIDALDPERPGADALRVGDVVVAVDDLLITTPAAGRRLANLEPGGTVRLWVRRDQRDVRVEVLAPAGCGPHGLTVRIPGAR